MQTTTAGSTEQTAQGARALGSRIDYLQIAFRVSLAEDVITTFRHRATAAREHGGGVAEIVIGNLIGEVRALRDGVDRWPIRNADLRGVVGLHEVGGWTVEIHVRAIYLATHSLEDAIAMCERLAASLGEVDGAPRIRRLDFAGDLVGFPLDVAMTQSWLTPRRGKLADFRPEQHVRDDGFLSPERRMYLRAGIVTGFAVCPGNDLSARVYDKTAELQLSGREEKREIEIVRWAAAGWTEGEPVTRVEFQARGVSLDELDLRNPHADRDGRAREIGSMLDPVWQYLTRKWLRLVQRVDERGDRCPNDPRWDAVQTIRFRHDSATPATRLRRRGGATYEQALGGLFSALAGAQKLPRVAVPVGASESTLTRDVAKTQVDALARSLLIDLGMTAAMNIAEYLQAKHGIEGAALAVVTRWNAAWSRFHSQDDADMPGAWTATPRDDGSGKWTLEWLEPTQGGGHADLVERQAIAEEPRGS